MDKRIKFPKRCSACGGSGEFIANGKTFDCGMCDGDGVIMVPYSVKSERPLSFVDLEIGETFCFKHEIIYLNRLKKMDNPRVGYLTFVGEYTKIGDDAYELTSVVQSLNNKKVAIKKVYGYCTENTFVLRTR